MKEALVKELFSFPAETEHCIGFGKILPGENPFFPDASFEFFAYPLKDAERIFNHYLSAGPDA